MTCTGQHTCRRRAAPIALAALCALGVGVVGGEGEAQAVGFWSKLAGKRSEPTKNRTIAEKFRTPVRSTIGAAERSRRTPLGETGMLGSARENRRNLLSRAYEGFKRRASSFAQKFKRSTQKPKTWHEALGRRSTVQRVRSAFHKGRGVMGFVGLMKANGWSPRKALREYKLMQASPKVRERYERMKSKGVLGSAPMAAAPEKKSMETQTPEQQAESLLWRITKAAGKTVVRAAALLPKKVGISLLPHGVQEWMGKGQGPGSRRRGNLRQSKEGPRPPKPVAATDKATKAESPTQARSHFPEDTVQGGLAKRAKELFTRVAFKAKATKEVVADQVKKTIGSMKPSGFADAI